PPGGCVAGGAGTAQAGPPWGPESPNFNLEVILRGGADGGFGHVTFRQPNDDVLIIQLETWVRDLKPLTSYLLQRATDVTLDGVCTGTNWLTLGKGSVPQALTTEVQGTGREDRFRHARPCSPASAPCPSARRSTSTSASWSRRRRR